MRVVFGEGPFAQALAAKLSTRGSVVLAGVEPVAGPWMWRAADPASGQGVRAAVEGAVAVHVVLDGSEPADGLFLVLARASRLRGGVVLPLGVATPRGHAQVPDLSVLRLGPAWGPEEPLVASWARTVAEGGRVWIADPGPMRIVPMDAAVAAAIALVEERGRTWLLAGTESVRLRDLAEALARGLGAPLRLRNVPLSWAAWRAGVDPARLRAWTRAPAAVSDCGGWHPPTAGRGAWLGDPARWRSGGGR